jgi:hypothetical protein
MLTGGVANGDAGLQPGAQAALVQCDKILLGDILQCW